MKNMMQSFTPFLKKFTLLGALVVFFGTASGSSDAYTYSDAIWTPFPESALTINGTKWTCGKEDARLEFLTAPYLWLAPEQAFFRRRVYGRDFVITGETETVVLAPETQDVLQRFARLPEGMELIEGGNKLRVNISEPSLMKSLISVAFNLSTIQTFMSIRDVYECAKLTGPKPKEVFAGMCDVFEGMHNTPKAISTHSVNLYDKFAAARFEDVIVGNAVFDRVGRPTDGLEFIARFATLHRYAQNNSAGLRGKPSLVPYQEITSDNPFTLSDGLSRLLQALAGYLALEKTHGLSVAHASDIMVSTLLTKWVAQVADRLLVKPSTNGDGGSRSSGSSTRITPRTGSAGSTPPGSPERGPTRV